MFDDTLEEYANRLELWLGSANVGSKITNLRLHYLNRALEQLQIHRPWEDQIAETSLTVTNKQATLPSDMLRILAVGYDNNSDKKAEYYYYSQAEASKGYTIIDSFTKAAGHSKVLHLYEGAPFEINLLRYQKRLEKYTDTGTEYLFFPGELLLKTAQLIAVEERGPGSKEYTSIHNSQKLLLREYEQAFQYQNQGFNRSIMGIDGRIIKLDNITLSGSDVREVPKFDNGTDL
jgi:hypothetical protein